MYVKMKNLTDLCIFIQCWRAIAYSGAAPEQLRNSTRAVCEAGWFVILQKLRASGWPCQPMHKRTGPLLLSDKQSEGRYQHK